MDKEINVQQADQLRRSNEPVAFLDVREDAELEICRLEGALHIPMAEVPERFAALPRDRPLVVFCHHGMRSSHVVQFLESKGLSNAHNLSGGIHAWALQIDPDMPRY